MRISRKVLDSHVAGITTVVSRGLASHLGISGRRGSSSVGRRDGGQVTKVGVAPCCLTPESKPLYETRVGGYGGERRKEGSGEDGESRSLVFLCTHRFPRLISSLDIGGILLASTQITPITNRPAP